MITLASASNVNPRARAAWHIARRTLEVVSFLSFLSTGVGLCWAVAAVYGLSEALGAAGWLQLAVALPLAAGVVDLVRRRTPNVRRYQP
ncbi:MAG TPA: hypothetical protein VFY44_03315 [Thermoleophilaceae bacterium]|nr:hypothetical protein [Thermoleophilaceae bacterium]